MQNTDGCAPPPKDLGLIGHEVQPGGSPGDSEVQPRINTPFSVKTHPSETRWSYWNSIIKPQVQPDLLFFTDAYGLSAPALTSILRPQGGGSHFPCEPGNMLKASGREGQDKDPWDLELTGKFQAEEQPGPRHGQDQRYEHLWFHPAGESEEARLKGPQHSPGRCAKGHPGRTPVLSVCTPPSSQGRLGSQEALDKFSLTGTL